jgi:hypothetical protein
MLYTPAIKFGVIYVLVVMMGYVNVSHNQEGTKKQRPHPGLRFKITDYIIAYYT